MELHTITFDAYEEIQKALPEWQEWQEIKQDFTVEPDTVLKIFKGERLNDFKQLANQLESRVANDNQSPANFDLFCLGLIYKETFYNTLTKLRGFNPVNATLVSSTWSSICTSYNNTNAQELTYEVWDSCSQQLMSFKTEILNLKDSIQLLSQHLRTI